MTTASKVTQRSEAWGIAAAGHDGGRCKAIAAAVLMGPALIFAAIGYAFWGLGGLAPALVALGVGYLILHTASRALDGLLRPAPIDDARVVNLVAGLSRDLDLATPPSFLVSGDGVNALVFWHSGHPSLGLTEEAVRSLPRTELEAVIAHCLARLDPHAGGLDRTALKLGGTVGGCGRVVTEHDDARAAAITRYPPALAKAIEKATPVEGRFSYLWFVGSGPAHPSQAARVAALQDL